MVNIGITGFGRIGRLIARQLYAQPELRKKIRLAGINDLTDPAQNAFAFKYDTVHGKFNGFVGSDTDSITIDGDKIPVSKCADPREIPWKTMGVDIVLECTGHFTDREKAALHMQGGAKKVIVSAPGKGVDLTVVMGVNHAQYDRVKHNILSNASCTTNCLAPVVHVLHKTFGIQHGLMTTVHSYTSDQRLLDNVHKDPRRARTAALNMIPTTTGAAKTVGEVIPALKGKLDGLSVRVPTPDVSFTDFVATLDKTVTKQQVNDALVAASKGELKGYLDCSNEPLVSSDYIGNRFSSIVDLDLTHVIGGADKSGNMVKVCAWYDNEVGFSTRMLDLVAHVAGAGF